MRMMTPLGIVSIAVTVAALAWGPAWAAGPLDHPGYAKALTCTACHGAGGNSPSSVMPIIAGLNAAYFKKQIADYAAGKRSSPEMEPYAKQVLQLGVDDVAAYFAAQKMEPTSIKSDAAAIARGRTAAATCVACHGQEGKGDPAKLIPSLAGQPPGYLIEQITLFKADKRSPGDAALTAIKAVMKTIPESAVPDLAAYYSSLR
jgi:cytochrome c553